jgi:hypothetical protein
MERRKGETLIDKMKEKVHIERRIEESMDRENESRKKKRKKSIDREKDIGKYG